MTPAGPLCWGAAAGAPWTWQPASVVAALYALQIFRGWLRQRASRFYLPDRQRDLAGARWFDILCGPITGIALCAALVWSAIGRRIVWKDNVYEMRYGGQIRKIPPRLQDAPGGGRAPRQQAA